MKPITAYDHLEELGRIRLSQNFFMRDFLYSEIAAWHGMRNVPDHPHVAVEVGRRLCADLLEPLQATFGRIAIRSGYRSPEVNGFGNRNKLNCASNESNFAAHIWDYPDANGKRGASACIVVPWLVDHVAKGGSWTDMAWWIHDHLPYSSLYFFPRLCAFNINWHEAPVRRVDSYAAPKGCLTRPGMSNHSGSHADEYTGFPGLQLGSARAASLTLAAGAAARGECSPPRSHERKAPLTPEAIVAPRAPSAVAVPKGSEAPICYRAIHTKNAWRKVGTHRSLDAAINGKDGAAALFARKVRINYARHGDPLFVLVWQHGAREGHVVKPDPSLPSGIRVVRVPIERLLAFEARGQASVSELEALLNAP